MLEIILIQPTNFCNIACRYCYLTNLNDKRILPQDTLREIARKVLSSSLLGDSLMVNWHLGEPMVVPRQFYISALRVFDELNVQEKRIFHTMQTNGTLIDDDWAKFFKQTDFGVGISIDGPAFLHDRVRVDRRGRGTHARVMQGVRCMQRHQVPFAGLCVLTLDTLKYPDEVFEFFREEGFSSIAFNVEEVESANSSTSLDGSDETVATYKAFMSRIFALWESTGRTIRIREFDDLIGSLAMKARDPLFYRNSDSGPLRILSFKHNGDITALSPELAGGTKDDHSAFVIGNIHHLPSLDDLRYSKRLANFAGEVEIGIHMCASECEYFDLCGGGSSANKYYENGSFASTKTVHCTLHRKALADVVIDALLVRQQS